MSHKRATLITSVFGMAAGMAGPAAAQCPDDTADLFGDRRQFEGMYDHQALPYLHPTTVGA